MCLMSAAQTVSKYLPFLRRYARALTGSQSSGDAYVAATLETLIKEPDLLGSSSNPKVALFRVFTSIWNSVPVNGATEPPGATLPAERRISQLTPRPRQAFLLVSLEGFSDEAAAEILGEELQGFRALVDEAVTLAKSKKPGLILADIQLADGSSGLDAVNELLDEFEVPVIFITAYPERFLTGQRPEPAFLIAKPFQPATVSAVVSQALFFQR